MQGWVPSDEVVTALGPEGLWPVRLLHQALGVMHLVCQVLPLHPSVCPPGRPSEWRLSG